MTVLERKLSRLLPKERKILQSLSIFWEQITLYDFQKLVKLLGIRSPQGQELSRQYFSVLENSLIKKQIIRSSHEYWGKGFKLFDSELKEHLTRESLESPWFNQCVQIVQKNFPVSDYTQWDYSGSPYISRLLRDLRISIYQENARQVAFFTNEIKRMNAYEDYLEVLLAIFANPLQNNLLHQLDSEIKSDVLSALLKNSIDEGENGSVFLEFIKENGIESDQIEIHKLETLFYQGNFAEINRKTANSQNWQELLVRATMAFIDGRLKDAISIFELAVAIWRRDNQKNKGYPDDWRLFLFSLAVYREDETLFYTLASSMRGSLNEHDNSSLLSAVTAFECYLKNQDTLAQESLDEIDSTVLSGKILQIIVSSIIPSSSLPVYAEELAAKCVELGYKWVQLETVSLIEKKGRRARTIHNLDALENELNAKPIADLIPPVESWKRILNVLKISDEEYLTKTERKTRIAWRLDFTNREVLMVEQKKTRSGWSKGRRVPHKDLKNRSINLADQDKVIIQSSIETSEQFPHFSANYFRFNWKEALLSMVGHPYIFLEKDPTISIELLKREPNLQISELDEFLQLSFDVEFHSSGVLIRKETETRYQVVQISEYHSDILDSFDGQVVNVPKEGRTELLQLVKSLSKKISIQSDLEEHFDDLPWIDSDNRIHVLITSIGDEYHLEFFVKPFRKNPPYFKPGVGMKFIVGKVEGVRTRTGRDLTAELDLANEIEEICPSLKNSRNKEFSWRSFGAEQLLQAMVQMERLREEGKLVVEWSRKQKFKLIGKIGLSDVSLNVKSENDWFKVSGTVKVDDETILSMKEVMEKVDAGAEFIELTDGNFIVITEKLRKHIYALNTIADEEERVHKLRTSVLQDFIAEVKESTIDKIWEDHIATLEAAKDFEPKLSNTFVGKLRKYQMDGYYWLCRLAHLGVGACLADDMGLGKTLQSLALLDRRATIGPALIVAPVSVCRNWVSEAKRFTPNLNLHILGEGDRQAKVKDLRENDVLVVSYSLLQSEVELLSSRKFATIVLDEAQAIKNSVTKRSKAAMKLQGEFRLVTSGTPIENHLMELWSIFNFLNPGLLGSKQFFKKQLATPIQKDNDVMAHQTLQKLIKPFILRRRKKEVLDDLPEKTEITLTVQLSDEERTFYESIRQNALEKLTSSDGQIKDKRFQIFAELIRLRQASCHPRLVNPDTTIESSKLRLFGRVIKEILDNRHKVLVFSQFVKHLGLIEEFLSDEGIEYHYLDGQTAGKLRQSRIEEFQSGVKSVFLISLKAGGTGLNLTEADYVIHLDPWWNPAVEDQATDRVHRIGQKRPVTVYRLVTEDSVEEKIVRLHQTKRELADSLLVGSDSSSKLSADDLLALISEK